ncbi:MAG: dual specificity protein phosphatase family protein [Candidatus Cloacimonetes bacterium]|nr:dual specificity protein phosphatase family protein [Candidatus Cloacimonadota bacterium]MDY0228587.1 dual specificity protein phosphatase family protein [Candidatus Cloacimonadaceae bacterium]
MQKPFPRSYWVREFDFLAGYTPADGNHQIMEEKLRSLVKAGICTIINLMEPDEVDYTGGLFEQYEQPLREIAKAQNREIAYHNIPIVDRNIPTKETMRRILHAINASLRQGKPVYVHCWGGKGRTGTVVGCWLVDSGIADGKTALKMIQDLRKDDPKRDDPSPETGDQESFVLNWIG